jgi:hypothetical protein
MDELRGAWGKREQTRSVIWPLIVRIGRKPMIAGDIAPFTKVSRRTKTLE